MSCRTEKAKRRAQIACSHEWDTTLRRARYQRRHPRCKLCGFMVRTHIVPLSATQARRVG